MVSPNASHQKEDKLLYPDHYLVWYAKVDSGPHKICVIVAGDKWCFLRCNMFNDESMNRVEFPFEAVHTTVHKLTFWVRQ